MYIKYLFEQSYVELRISPHSFRWETDLSHSFRWEPDVVCPKYLPGGVDKMSDFGKSLIINTLITHTHNHKHVPISTQDFMEPVSMTHSTMLKISNMDVASRSII